MVKNITKRNRKQELSTRKILPITTIYEKDIITIEEVDIKDVPEGTLMETVVVIPDETGNLDKTLKKSRKQAKHAENNFEQKSDNNE